MRKGRMIAALLVTTFGFSVLAAAPHASALPCLPVGNAYTLYVSFASGNDSNNGCGTGTALKTLNQANLNLLSSVAGLHLTVYVRVEPAPTTATEHHDLTTFWDYSDASASTYILPYGVDPNANLCG